MINVHMPLIPMIGDKEIGMIRVLFNSGAFAHHAPRRYDKA